MVYYSLSGNTEKIAKRLAYSYDAGRVVKIETVNPYTGSYNDIVDQGQREVESGFQPGIRLTDVSSYGEPNEPLDLDDFDIIAIGTPTWWYTYAPAVAAFLKMFDWSGRTVVPFQTHGGWKGHVMADFKKVGAVIRNKLDKQFDSTGGNTQITPQKDIDDWTKSFNNI